ncbi:alpha/beta hydrolase [Plantactinospora siamensis]|uniref:Alpha/beta hydrolase n=1 Tax=Plantactinospora siamensis TaxID=555372 RepID=A0ABV6NZ83_9ACTN
MANSPQPRASRSTADTIVLLHGLWMTPRSWAHWADRYSRAGFRVLTPAWPGLEVEVEQLRRDPSPIAALTPERVIEHYADVVRGLDRPPILMGHSFGGAFVQLLLDRGLGAAGVAIDPAPVRGVVRLPLSTLRAAFPILRNPANRHRAVPLTHDQFHFAFTNTLDEADSRAAYDRYAVPGAGSVLFGNAVANWERHSPFDVNFANDDRAPLLLVAGGADHVAPASTTRATAKLHRKSTALTGYREFSGRSHFTVGQPGWEEVADYALEWAVEATSPHLVLAEGG